MSAADETWQVALPKSRPGYELGAALFTTYDRPQAEFLVEHLLPSLLPLAREIGDAPETRALYFGELAIHLERLHGRLSIFSSPVAAGQAEDSGTERGNAYPWLWRYVDLFQTGAAGAAVQHAKLWMLHWIESGAVKREHREFLEVYVSSTNLTLSAFRDQLQAGWHGVFELEPRSSQARRASWGVLPRFLDALGEASGVIGLQRTAHFTEVLGRCEPPESIEFVASIPSQSQRPTEKKRFGAAALAAMAPSGRSGLRVQVCAPFVGEWSESAIRDWCEDLGAEPENVTLSWIDTEHPWASSNAREGIWRMTPSTHAALGTAGLEIHRLGHARQGPSSLFHERQHEGDPRWSHAKLYALQRGNSKRLLLTSANFSQAAWGSGKVAARNFELGVLTKAEWPIDPQAAPFSPGQVPHTCEAQLEFGDSTLVWAQATWDGQRVSFDARAQAGTTGISVVVDAMGTAGSVLMNLRQQPAGEGGWTGEVPWSESRGLPVSAVFTSGEFALQVPILDLRGPKDFSTTPLPEVAPAVAEALKDALLVERYGGAWVEPEDVPGLVRGEVTGEKKGGDAADYSLAIMETARDDFEVVDSWAAHLKRAADEGAAEEARRIVADGGRLLALYLRRASAAGPLTKQLPARLVAEELQARLEEQRDER